MPRWPAAVRLLLGAITTSCGAREVVILTPAFAPDSWVVAVVTDEAGVPLLEAPLVRPPGGALRFEVPSTPVRLHAWELAPPDQSGPRVDWCGVRFGGPGALLGAPRASWIAPLTTLGDAAVELAPDPRGPMALKDLNVRLDCLPETDCDALAVDVYPAPFTDLRIEQVVALDDRRAVVAPDADNNGGDFALYLVEDGQWRRLPDPTPRPEGAAMSLSLDSDTGRVVGNARDGRIFEVDVTTSSVVLGEAGTPLARLVVGAERWIWYGALGLRVHRGPRLPPFGEKVDAIAPIARDLIALTSSLGVYLYDGSVIRRERSLNAFDRWTTVAGDTTIIAAGNALGGLLVRDPINGDWNFNGYPFGQNREIQALATLGEERLLVVGDQGLLAIFDGRASADGQCERAPPPIAAPLLSVSRSPSGRVFFAGGGQDNGVPGEQSALLRIEVD